MAGTSVTVIDTGLAPESFSPGGTVSEMTVVLEDGANPDAARDNVSDVLGGDFTVLTADEVRAETQESISSILDMVNTFLLIYVFLALGIGIFIIADTFRISVRQRQKEFVLLGAVGAAPSQVFVVVFVQAIIIRLIGSVVGVIAGQGLILLTRWGLEAWGMPLDADLIMTPSIIITSIIIGVIVTVIAALMPARSAALTPPIEAMRETSGATEKPLTVRTIIGGTIVALGVAAFAAGALRAMDRAGPLLGLGALFIIVGLIVMTPTLVGPAVAVLGWAVPQNLPDPRQGRLRIDEGQPAKDRVNGLRPHDRCRPRRHGSNPCHVDEGIPVRHHRLSHPGRPGLHDEPADFRSFSRCGTYGAGGRCCVGRHVG